MTNLRLRWLLPLAVPVGLALGLLLAPAPTVDAQPKPAPARKYATGRKVNPAKLAEAKRLSALLHNHKLKALPKATAPSFDCRQFGWVPPIRDQGQCGSCWDFSGSGVVTCAFLKAGTGKNDGSFAISEQYTLDCGNNGGCNGDDNINVLDWSKTKGLPTDTDYGVPYRAGPGRCQAKSGLKLYQLKDWGFTDPNNQQGVSSTQSIKDAMVAYGPIGCAVDAGFSDPGTGVISGGGNNIDHDVILVGWDDTKGRGGAWIMRNSWGTGWGNQGYAWIEYGAFSIGTEAVWALAPGSPPPPPPAAPVITSPLVAAGSVGAAFTYQIAATNSPTAFDAKLLPGGLVVDQKTGGISGTPTTAGVYAVTISAANAAGAGTATLALTVGGGPGPTPVGTVTITLTPEQVQQVIDQSGTITITPGMTVPELLDALDKLRQKRPTKAEPPLRKSSTAPPPPVIREYREPARAVLNLPPSFLPTYYPELRR